MSYWVISKKKRGAGHRLFQNRKKDWLFDTRTLDNLDEIG